MDDEDEDFYAGNGASTQQQTTNGQDATTREAVVKEEKTEELEEGEEEEEEEEEESDSDIDIITEKKEGAPPVHVLLPRLSVTKNEHQRTVSAEQPSRSSATPVKTEPKTPAPIRSVPSVPQKPGYEYPEVRTSTIDLNANPIYEPAQKPITELDFDADLAEHDKPWRRPGTDQSDYFNYGFDEFSWATYCIKQKAMKETIKAQKAESQNFEMMFGGPMPGMPGVPSQAGLHGGGTAQAAQQQQQQQPQQQPQQQQQQVPPQQQPGHRSGIPGMPGMPDMSPEMMNAMMQQMMASGMDPNQMDFNTFMQQVQQMQQAAAHQGGQAQGYGGQAQQAGQMGYPGYGQMAMDGGDARRTGNYGQRGRGGGRRW